MEKNKRKKNTIEKKWERNREKEWESERENKKKSRLSVLLIAASSVFLFFFFLVCLFFVHRKLFDLEILLGDFVLKVVLFPLESDDPLMILDQNGLHVSCQNSKSPWNILLFQSRIRTILTGVCVSMCVCVCVCICMCLCFSTHIFFSFFPPRYKFLIDLKWTKVRVRKNVCKNKNTCCHFSRFVINRRGGGGERIE